MSALVVLRESLGSGGIEDLPVFFMAGVSPKDVKLGWL